MPGSIKKTYKRGISLMGKILSYAIFIIWFLITAIPLVWMLYSSFKSNEELVRDIYAPPHDLFFNAEDEYVIIERDNLIRLNYDPDYDKRERVFIESTTITPGRRFLVHILIKEDLPPEVAQLKPGTIIKVKQLPWQMRMNIQFRTVFFNFIESIQTGGLIPKFFNSVLYASASTFFIVLLGLMMGFGLSKMKFPRISKIVMALIGTGYLVSLNSILIPLFLMLSFLKLTDTHFGIILVYTAFGIPLSVLLSTQFISGLPDSLIESAYMDGASIYTAFFKIIVPICKPVIITISIISALGIWNEFLLVLVIGSSEVTKSLPVGIYSFSSLTSTQLGWQLAALVIGTLPAMLVYFAFNKYLTQGVIAGSVKE